MTAITSNSPLVAHVIDELPPDGAERLIVDLMRRRSHRYRYVVVCLIRGGLLVAELEALGVPVVLIPRRGRIDPGLVLRLARWFRRERVAVVHTHLFTADTYGRLAARLAGVPAVFTTIHSVNDWKGAVHRMIDRMLARLSTRVIGCTREVGHVLVDRDRLPAARVDVVENGIDLLRFDAADASAVRAEFGIGADAVLVGVVGRLHPVKGHADLFAALSALRGRTARRIACLVIGDGELRAALEARVRELDLADSVVFAGLRSDVPRLLRALDLVAMPSHWEGLPMALLEAMACAKPVVVTSVGGIPSVIEDGTTGLMVRPKSPDALAGALRRLVEDPALAARLGARAQSLALARYDVGRVVDAYERAYDIALRLPSSASLDMPAREDA